MGYNKRNGYWRHVNPLEALNYFNLFWWWVVINGFGWKRHVYSEHVKFITEYTEEECFVGRSIYRSVQEYYDFDDINKVNWWKGYIARRDPISKEIRITFDSDIGGIKQFRKLYRQCRGTGNF